jgi:molybdate transport system substrate-binding protein
MKGPLVIILVLLAATAGVIAWLQRTKTGPTNTSQPLVVFCAANLKKPVEAAAAEFQRECGTPVQLQYGGSATLLNQLRLAKTGDLFIAADDGTMADARKLDTVREVIPLAKQHPVIAVKKGNPKSVRALADLLRADVRVALANPEAASIGRVTKATLAGKWEPLATRAAVMKPTVTDIASDLSLGTVDAAVVWNSTVPQFNGLEAVEIPEFEARVENAAAGVLASSTQATNALRFARWLAAPDRGAPIFQKFGFTPAGGNQ